MTSMQPGELTSSEMRAARIIAPRELRLETVAVPSPGPRQVRFRVEGCGVSSSPAWLGRSGTQYPRAPGESPAEAWGTIDALGSEVQGLRVGQRIAALSERSFAELDVVDAAAALALPGQLATLPFPGQALAGAFNVFARGGIVARHNVAVIGIGFLGALLARLATAAGARVIALSRRPFSLTLGREMGATAVVQLDDGRRSPEIEVAALTEGALCDVVVEATGTQTGLDVASKLCAVRGTLVIAGRHRGGARQVDLELWEERALNVVNAHERQLEAQRAGMKAAVRACAEGQLDVSNLYTHSYGLEGVAEALDLAENRPLGLIKALILP